MSPSFYRMGEKWRKHVKHVWQCLGIQHAGRCPKRFISSISGIHSFLQLYLSFTTCHMVSSSWVSRWYYTLIYYRIPPYCGACTYVRNRGNGACTKSVSKVVLFFLRKNCAVSYIRACLCRGPKISYQFQI